MEHISGEHVSGKYFWGTPNTSITFCEDKYIIVPWIAEYYNTLSCVAFILAGLPFIRGQMKDVAWMTILVGIGSMALHGTLQQYGQWMDEMAMISLNYMAARHFYKRLPLYFLPPILVMYYKNSDYFISFFSIFTLMQYFVWKEIMERKHRINSFYIYAYHIFFILGFGCWVCDYFICDYVQSYQMHAWWHIFSALTIFSCMLGFHDHQHVQ